MTSTYDQWIHHGEALDGRIIENADHLNEHIPFNEDVGMNEGEEDLDDRIPDMVKELFIAEEQGAENSMFAAILEEMKEELFPGAAVTRFSFVVKLLHIKSFYRISNAAFTAILKLLSLAFPACSLPTSYDEAKKLIRALGLGYDTIHVCPNNCVLFRKGLAKHDNCPVCGESRWKDADGRKQIPQKVLRHFPLVPRLKRIVASKKTAEEAQWHKLKRKPVENELSHPADGEAWKEFDRKYEWFAKDARNIRLGLATDGFNPFGKMNSSYSMWPVFVVPYNFPPWICMDESNFMMSLLIPGPECPGKDFDVFLEPLVEELLTLWAGLETKDAFSGKEFKLHAAVIWCIHDYPALSTLSGRVTKGYYACVRCDKNPCSRRIRNKICYIGHRRFLPRDHPWRTKKYFDGQTEKRDKPEEFSIDELMQQLERVKDVRPGKHPGSKDDDMNAIMAAPVEDEQQPNTAIEAVSQVLPSSKFLQNVGLQPALKKRSSRAETLRVQELEAQLEKEKQDKEELRQKLDGQQQEIDNLKKQSEEARQKHLEDVGDLKKQLEENNALLRGLISFNQSQ
ncbi:uncharacterized protein LOC120681025 [Panicum virgatum]|uniref:uncharacterized protein LOC120681025 n=1 Tax=Panicum virgatum TaxID=38727 RepID=UPI0019D61D4E|nr:uncharacterized protein LOC120681025 [Panicum virgatum]